VDFLSSALPMESPLIAGNGAFIIVYYIVIKKPVFVNKNSFAKKSAKMYNETELNYLKNQQIYALHGFRPRWFSNKKIFNPAAEKRHGN
jgi:hypothetical protein